MRCGWWSGAFRWRLLAFALGAAVGVSEPVAGAFAQLVKAAADGGFAPADAARKLGAALGEVLIEPRDFVFEQFAAHFVLIAKRGADALGELLTLGGRLGGVAGVLAVVGGEVAGGVKGLATVTNVLKTKAVGLRVALPQIHEPADAWQTLAELAVGAVGIPGPQFTHHLVNARRCGCEEVVEGLALGVGDRR